MAVVQPRPIMREADVLPSGLRLFVQVDVTVSGMDDGMNARQSVGLAANVITREIGRVLNGSATIPDAPGLSSPWSGGYMPGDRVRVTFRSAPTASPQVLDVTSAGITPRRATAGSYADAIARAVASALDFAGFAWSWNAGTSPLSRVGLARADAELEVGDAVPFDPDEYNREAGTPGLVEMIGSAVGTVARKFVAAVGSALGSGVGSFLGGLGPWVLLLVVALVLYLLLRR